MLVSRPDQVAIRVSPSAKRCMAIVLPVSEPFRESSPDPDVHDSQLERDLSDFGRSKWGRDASVVAHGKSDMMPRVSGTGPAGNNYMEKIQYYAEIIVPILTNRIIFDYHTYQWNLEPVRMCCMRRVGMATNLPVSKGTAVQEGSIAMQTARQHFL